MSAPLSPERRADALLVKAADAEELCTRGHAGIRRSLGLYGEETLTALVDGVREVVPALLAHVVEVTSQRDYWHEQAMSADQRLRELEARVAELTARVGESR